MGALNLAARLFDAGIDPWLGWLADRGSPARLVFLSLPDFAVGFIALFNPPGAYPALWLAASLLLTTFAYSAASVAYLAWGVDLGQDSTARTRLTAAREGCSLLGVVLAAVAPSLLATEASMQRLVDSAEKDNQHFDQLIAADNSAGQQLVRDAIAALVRQTSAIELAAGKLGISDLQPDTADHQF